MQKVVIYGGSGFLGNLIKNACLAQGFSVVIVDRNAPPEQSGVSFVLADTTYPITKNDFLRKPYAVINLTGKNIAQRFTEQHRKEIYTTRIMSTRNIVRLFENPEYRPDVFVQASAVGYYGDRGGDILDESSESGSSFLSTVVIDWENEAHVAKQYGVRTVILRQGNVLGRGGFMAKIIPLYKKWVGGDLGSGDFWFPWIHETDLIRLYIYALQHEPMKGVLNAVAGPIIYRDFSLLLARSLHVPHVISTPVWMLRFLYGDFAYEMTSSMRVVSNRLSHYGFTFHFHDCAHAIWDLKKNWK
jgi:uncharacterized protein (TIGR01777 family)